MALGNCTETTPQCPVKDTIYGYEPSLGANAFFAAWFFILLAPNLLFGIRYKTWTYMLALALGCLDEGLGYIGRTMLHNNPWSSIGFQIQICCLILGPAFNSAAIYLTLKHITLAFGPEYSIIKPRFYTYIFITGDLISLVLQAIGGGTAATANDNKHRQDLGTHIMIAGIVWQVITLLVFGTVAGLYVWRRFQATNSSEPLSTLARRTYDSPKFKLFASGVVTAFICVFTRCVYRIIEMAGGWGNGVMRDEPSYIALEGVMIAIATGVQTVFHPGFCFPQMSSQRQQEYVDKAHRDVSQELQQRSVVSAEGEAPKQVRTWLGKK